MFSRVLNTKLEDPPSLGFAVLLAARVRLLEEVVEASILVTGVRGTVGVLVFVMMAAGVVPVVVAMARHGYERDVTGRRGTQCESVSGPTLLLKACTESFHENLLCCGVAWELSTSSSQHVDNASSNKYIRNTKYPRTSTVSS